MRFLLVLSLLGSFAAACGGSKKAAKSPAAPAASESSADDESKESDLKDADKPDGEEDMRSKGGDDPCDGGE